MRVSPTRLLRSGLGVAWVQYPLNALDRLNLGRIRIGWSSVRVESMGVRPTQCYRWWEFGHVRDSCRSTNQATVSDAERLTIMFEIVSPLYVVLFVGIEAWLIVIVSVLLYVK